MWGLKIDFGLVNFLQKAPRSEPWPGEVAPIERERTAAPYLPYQKLCYFHKK